MKKFRVTATKFKVDDHVRVRRFRRGLHELDFESEREPYVGLVAVVVEIYDQSILRLKFADDHNWLWPVEACDFQWSLTMQHQFVTGDVVRALPYDENKNDLFELVRPYFWQRAVVLTAGEKFVELEFEDGQHRRWPVNACEFKYRPWANSPSTTIDPGCCTHNHGGPCPNCPRFNVIAESQIAAGNLTYVCACGAKLLWDPRGGCWLRFKEFQYGDSCEMRLLPPAAAPIEREHAQPMTYSYNFATINIQQAEAAIASVVKALDQMTKNLVAGLNPFMTAVKHAIETPLPAPYDCWRAHALEGSLASCPCCEQLIPASLVPAIKDQKTRCPLCNHTGSQPVCPICRGLLITSHPFFNVRERWHCQDCGRQFDGDRKQL